MKQGKKISVVIPCWNSEIQLKQNLQSVFVAASAVKAEIIVVDDYSQDGSLSYLESLGTKIKLIKNLRNLGFGSTVNLGVKHASGDIVILINTDVSPSANCFQLVGNYFVDPKVFSVGFNSDEGFMRITWERGLFHHFKQEYDPLADNLEVLSVWSSGGQGAFDKKKWEEIGGMDLIYEPFYWEDTDLGYRAWKHGWTNLFAPDCKCIHRHKQSVIANNFPQDKIYSSAQRNQFLFIWKNITDVPLLITHLLWLPFYLYHYPKTIILALKRLPQALQQRHQVKKYWVKSDRDILKLWIR